MKMKEPYQICSRCIMDTTAADIAFNGDGVCNYCTDFLERSGHVLRMDSAERNRALNALVERVRASGAGKRYDCIVGVSGGVDSSWTLVQTVKLGLRPLAVHMDNGWNSELAQNNIANLVRALDVDLYTYVIDWDEYRGLMQAFFDADVVDVELLYDNAMLAVNYQQARRHRLKYILAGSNTATEGMGMPPGWNWFKYDVKNIRALGKRFGGITLRTFPAIGTWGFVWYEHVLRIHWTKFLDFLDYSKFLALESLQSSYGYKPYQYKHYESVFTRFYQGYILPKKFGVDKRKLHLSALIATGQISRRDALQTMQDIPYPSRQAEQDDVSYFLKKMGWSRTHLDEYISRPAKHHMTYPSEKPLWQMLGSLRKRVLRKQSA